jgi:hypothetical protein
MTLHAFNRCLPAALGAMLLCAPVSAQVIYNELVQGDLSGNRFAPNPLSLSPGSNQLVGLMAGDLGGGEIDRDYFSITVPSGHVLSQVVLDQYFSNDPVAFLAIQPGPVFPDDPQTVNPGDLMGWIHLGAEHVGLDVLPIMATQGFGFTPPLAAGIYSFWAQQLGEPTDYVLDFVVTVPGPGAAAVLCIAGAMIRRRTVR